jgi:regulatory protein
LNSQSFRRRKTFTYSIDFENEIVGKRENAHFAMVSADAYRTFNSEANDIEHIVMPKVQSLKPKAGKVLPAENAVRRSSARLEALKMLGRRELSEAQVRTRLARKGHSPEDIDEAVERLKAERAIDDSRVAAAIARTETSLKRRGKRRVVQQIQQAGISRSAAKQAIDETFDDLDEGALLQAALSRRLKPERDIADDREFRRLYRHLIRQGFDADDVIKALSGRRAR